MVRYASASVKSVRTQARKSYLRVKSLLLNCRRGEKKMHLSENEGIEGNTFVVTGGLGFVGSALCLELDRRGARRVRAFDLRTQSQYSQDLHKQGIHCIQGLISLSLIIYVYPPGLLTSHPSLPFMSKLNNFEMLNLIYGVIIHVQTQ